MKHLNIAMTDEQHAAIKAAAKLDKRSVTMFALLLFEERCPVVIAPVQSTTAPVQSTTAPVQSTTAPVQSTPARALAASAQPSTATATATKRTLVDHEASWHRYIQRQKPGAVPLTLAEYLVRVGETPLPEQENPAPVPKDWIELNVAYAEYSAATKDPKPLPDYARDIGYIKQERKSLLEKPKS